LNAAPERDAVGGYLVQRMSIECQRNVLLYAGMDEAPALYLSRAHPYRRHELPVDQGWMSTKTKRFKLSGIVIAQLLQDEDLLARARDFRQDAEIAILRLATLDDQGAGHAAGELHRRRTVDVSVIPKGPGGCFSPIWMRYSCWSPGWSSTRRCHFRTGPYRCRPPGLWCHMKAMGVQVRDVKTEMIGIGPLEAAVADACAAREQRAATR